MAFLEDSRPIPFLKQSGPEEVAQMFRRSGVSIDIARDIAKQLNMNREKFDYMNDKDFVALVQKKWPAEFDTISKLKAMVAKMPTREKQFYDTHNPLLDRKDPPPKINPTRHLLDGMHLPPQSNRTRHHNEITKHVRTRTFNRGKYEDAPKNPYCVKNIHSPEANQHATDEKPHVRARRKRPPAIITRTQNDPPQSEPRRVL